MKHKRSGLVVLGLLSVVVLGGCSVVPAHHVAYRSTGYSTPYGNGHGDAGYRSGQGYCMGHGGFSGMGYGHRGGHH